MPPETDLAPQTPIPPAAVPSDAGGVIVTGDTTPSVTGDTSSSATATPPPVPAADTTGATDAAPDSIPAA